MCVCVCVCVCVPTAVLLAVRSSLHIVLFEVCGLCMAYVTHSLLACFLNIVKGPTPRDLQGAIDHAMSKVSFVCVFVCMCMFVIPKHKHIPGRRVKTIAMALTCFFT